VLRCTEKLLFRVLINLVAPRVQRCEKIPFFASIVGHKFSAPLLIFNLTSSAPLERSNARGCALQGIDSDYEKD
jgi:hypothetical protein